MEDHRLLKLTSFTGGVQAAASASSNSTNSLPATSLPLEQMLYIATSLGLSLIVTAWTFFRVSGSVFNPNVATGLLICGSLSPLRFLFYIVAEFAGAIAASALLRGLMPGDLAITVAVAPGVNRAQAVFIEVRPMTVKRKHI